MNPLSLNAEQRDASRRATLDPRGDATNIRGVHTTLYSYYHFSTPQHPFCAIGFPGKAIKPTLSYRYPSEQARTDSLNRWIDRLRLHARRLTQRQEARVCAQGMMPSHTRISVSSSNPYFRPEND